ncbi:hypothetical protein K8R03_02590 [Candidatus Kaiserbacteria bacterium]|nr:hypothetical protein [Candidatus Kaiserbacteria bacterium]
MADSHAPKPSLEAKAMNTVSNFLAIAGFLILIVIVVWGLFHIATLSSGWFTSLFHTSNKTSTISVTAPETAISGKATRITWNYPTTDAGRYAFLYECTDGLEFGIPVLPPGETRAQLSRVPCGAAFTMGNATSSVILVPILSTSTPKVARMTVLFAPTTTGTPVSGTAKMTVNVNTEPQSAATSSEPVSKPTPDTTPRPSSPADLQVSLVSVTTDGSGQSVATFNIENVGGSPSGTYYFTALLPTSQPYTFASQPQSSLGAGDHILNTLRFTQTVSGLFSVTVSGDSNVSNNTASQNVVVPYIYNTYNGYTDYNQYPVYQY